MGWPTNCINSITHDMSCFCMFFNLLVDTVFCLPNLPLSLQLWNRSVFLWGSKHKLKSLSKMFVFFCIFLQNVFCPVLFDTSLGYRVS